MNNKKKLVEHDKYAINTNDKHEIEYWSIKLGVTTEELLKAVDEVGRSSIDVKRHIKSKT
ncbi:MAG: DUF3606 domain-containing protein [Sphingobacteriaceae bacterium]|nr:MAG: DUF3606 domain-containing protein [Sphingobacteriaceae bacterium]